MKVMRELLIAKIFLFFDIARNKYGEIFFIAALNATIKS